MTAYGGLEPGNETTEENGLFWDSDFDPILSVFFVLDELHGERLEPEAFPGCLLSELGAPVRNAKWFLPFSGLV